MTLFSIALMPIFVYFLINNWIVLEEDKTISFFWVMMQRLMLMNLKMVLLRVI